MSKTARRWARTARSAQRPAILPWPSFFHRFARGIDAPAHFGGVCRHATTSLGPPYSLLAASLKLSGPRFTIATPAGALVDPAGTISVPTHGASIPPGSTTYSGNFEAALVGLTLP